MHVAPQIMFEGQASDALALWTLAFPKLHVTSRTDYKDGKILRATATLGSSTLHVIDSPIGHDFGPTPSVSLFVEHDSAVELRHAWEVLSADGQILMPLDTYDFAPLFGWLNDRYGISWQLSLGGGPK